MTSTSKQMSETYSIDLEVRWADLDPNGHVRHSVYFDFGAQARVGFLEDRGFGVARMEQAGVGPVLFSETAQYRRELRSGERVRVDVQLVGVSQNRKHWAMRHRIHRSDGELACIIDCRGAWLDLRERRVIPAPDALVEVLGAMEHSEDFASL